MAGSFSRENEGTHRRRKVDEKSCVTPAGTSNELDVQSRMNGKKTCILCTGLLQYYYKIVRTPSY